MAASFVEVKRNRDPIPVRLPGIKDIPARAREIHEMIARRAYTIYEGRGRMDGHEREDWLQAESDVLSTLFVGFMELDGSLSVDIGIRTCDLPRLQVAIEPRRLIVSGKRKVYAGEMAHGLPGEKPRRVEIFQVVDFPVRVEPSRAKATLSNCLLQLRIPKAQPAEKSLAARAA